MTSYSAAHKLRATLLPTSKLAGRSAASLQSPSFAFSRRSIITIGLLQPIAGPSRLPYRTKRIQTPPRTLTIRLSSSSTPKSSFTENVSMSDEQPLQQSPVPEPEPDLHESPYTIPNALTIARILACPYLGYTIIHGQYELATGILFTAGFSDWLDGYLARTWNQRTVLGSILDPMADKTLMTTLVGTLAWSGLLPIPLAVIIFGRDFALSMSAFYFRYISLPKPRTLKRYFDPTMPSAEVKPTQISKINTALQLLLMGLTTVSPLIGVSVALPLQALQWTVAGTTIWSGFSYIGRSGVNILKQPGK